MTDALFTGKGFFVRKVTRHIVTEIEDFNPASVDEAIDRLQQIKEQRPDCRLRLCLTGNDDSSVTLSAFTVTEESDAELCKRALEGMKL